MADTYETKEGDTVDSIAWQHYGRHEGSTEALREANRGLAQSPLVLPAGLTVILPDLPEVSAVQPVKLYD
ncbi:tail protein X [Halocynthiibacter styelae]|uniref:Tail protein X n=1 Tax=Halocynthiibacter styelae TaxID=2761955 RepID=A0A8J7IFY9_9RHOB|nr:tail protein X [Paenihalocynthiibacter styelae]MBI1495417.1 tail protein X [Paenihalocynthiibacter styelae]